MKSPWKPWLGAAVVAVSILLATKLLEDAQRRSLHDRERETVAAQLAEMRAGLEAAINGNLMMVRGLSAAIAARPDIDESGFAAIASHMVSEDTPMRHIAGAPGLVIRFVYPMADNHAAIGLDYRTHSEQRDAAIAAIEAGQMVVAGPLQLVQGGTALVAREPVFTGAGPSVGSGELWGLVSAAIDLERLYQLSGLEDYRERFGLDVAIRGRDGLGPMGDQFYGTASVYERRPAITEVSLPYGSWEMAATPVGGWGSRLDRGSLTFTRTAGVALAMLLSLVTYRTIRGNEALKATSAALTTSESRYRLAQRLSGLGIWEWDIRADRVAWSDEVVKMLGADGAVLDDGFQAVAERIHPDDLQPWRDDVEACLHTGREHRLELRIRQPDGSYRWIETFGDVERDATGQPLRMLGLVADITQRKRAEEKRQQAERALREKERFISHALDAAQSGIYIYDRLGGRHIYVNSRYVSLTGYTLDELNAMEPERFMERFPVEDLERIEEHAAALRDIGDGEANEIEYRFRTRDGRLAWFRSWDAVFERDPDGKAQSIIGTFIDITRLKQTEQALREGETRYRLLVENQTDLIVKVAPDGRFEFVSPSYCRTFGKQEHELLGRTFMPLVHDDDRATTEQAMQRLFRPPYRCYLEQRALTANGWRWLAWSDTAVLDADGQVEAIIGCGRDITARKEAELALRENERRFRAVFDQQFQFTAILSPNGETLEINELPLQVTGARREDFVGRPFWESPAWAGLADWEAIWQERFAEAKTTNVPILTHDVYRAAGGELREADAATKAIRNDRGEVEFLLVQASDNTERHRAEQERDRLLADLQSLNQHLEGMVRERTAQLLDANRELESFAYAVSHDLRAPVRAISGFETALREDHAERLPGEGREFLDEIRVGAARMNALIDGLLDLSRSTRGELHRIEVDLAQLSNDIVAELARNDPDRRVSLEVAGDLRVSGDPRLVRTLMHNLLENAWKYSRLRDDAIIRVTREPGESDRFVCVEDNGTGFEPEFGHKLFDPFQRLHGQGEFPGVGIGLATAARIVRRHGGEIAGCGRPGKGARFCFSLDGRPVDG